MTEESLIVAINDDPPVLMVGTKSEVLAHIRQHLQDHQRQPLPNPPVDEAPARRPIQFFNSDGSELNLVVVNLWEDIDLIAADRAVDTDPTLDTDRTDAIESLRARVERVIATRWDDWAAAFDVSSSPAKLPSDSDWKDLLENSKLMATGGNPWQWPDEEPEPQPAGGPIAAPDHRNIFHDWIVHHGRP